MKKITLSLAFLGLSMAGTLALAESTPPDHEIEIVAKNSTGYSGHDALVQIFEKCEVIKEEEVDKCETKKIRFRCDGNKFNVGVCFLGHGSYGDSHKCLKPPVICKGQPRMINITEENGNPVCNGEE